MMKQLLKLRMKMMMTSMIMCEMKTISLMMMVPRVCKMEKLSKIIR
jgi:hypothetical protein